MHQTVIQAAASEQFLALKLCFIVKYTISCFLNEKKNKRWADQYK